MVNHRPKQAGQRLVLVPPGTPAPPSVTAPTPAPQELVLDGRRYRLVPVDGEAAPTTPPPPLESASTLVERSTPADVLTARELQIVALVAEGRANKQIAAELGISEWTVSTHLRRIYAKLDVDTRAAMVNRCYGALSVRPPVG